MAYYQGGMRGGYFAPTIRRRMGWWTILPLWGILTRTMLALGISLWIAVTAQASFASPGSPVALSQVALQGTLLDLATLLEDGIDALVKGVGQEATVEGWTTTRPPLNSEAHALENTLRGVGSTLRDPLHQPMGWVQRLERRASVFFADGRSVTATLGSIVERGDYALRVAGHDMVSYILWPAYRAVEQWLVSRRMW